MKRIVFLIATLLFPLSLWAQPGNSTLRSSLEVGAELLQTTSSVTRRGEVYVYTYVITNATRGEILVRWSGVLELSLRPNESRTVTLRSPSPPVEALENLTLIPLDGHPTIESETTGSASTYQPRR